MIFVLLLCSTSLFAQDADVVKAVELLKQGMLDGNREVLERVTHENLTYGHSSGLTEDKKTFVEALASGNSDFLSIEISDQQVKVTGNTATVRHKLSGEMSIAGKQSSINLSVLLVFVKEKGTWKLLARQAVKIQAP